jgi:alkanesulfonate monooxygenase SsuD/methylene tetrahydromethanopterin reductase-like flavin-dependent oxidoreductase (luciferase family)
MKFGIFFELSTPRPWTPESEHRLYHESLAQVRLADELGFDHVWCVEHHFLEEYSHSSAPEVFLAACAAQTKRIRVGHGIVVCVPQINHPARIAERAAALDLISSGRLDLGTGRSGTWTELGGFEADPDETKKTWDEYVRAIPQMWMQERFRWRGRSFSMPLRAVLPKPYQKPHPPLWVAVTSPGTEIDAAERGLGALGLSMGSVADYAGKIENYKRVIRDCEPVGAFVNDQIAAVNFLYCHQDDATGVATGQRLAGTFNYLASQLLSTREAFPTRSYPSLGLLPALRSEAAKKGDDGGPSAAITIGNPARIESALRRWESAGVDCVNFLLNCAETVPQEEVLASLRLFAKEVMPRFQNREAR